VKVSVKGESMGLESIGPKSITLLLEKVGKREISESKGI
jgi:hypothetical protein